MIDVLLTRFIGVLVSANFSLPVFFTVVVSSLLLFLHRCCFLKASPPAANDHSLFCGIWFELIFGGIAFSEQRRIDCWVVCKAFFYESFWVFREVAQQLNGD